MFVLGITGGIGSGKSTVSGLLAERGLLVLDADEISRNVTGPMGRAMPEIAETFGKKVVSANGALNRRVMSDIAFGDKKKLDDMRAKMEGICDGSGAKRIAEAIC